MHVFDYEAVVWNGAVYCVGCVPESANWDDVLPVFAGSEWDAYPVCDACGCQHDYVSLIGGQRA